MIVPTWLRILCLAAVMFGPSDAFVFAEDGDAVGYTDGAPAVLSPISTWVQPSTGETLFEELALRPFSELRDPERGLRIEPVYYGECLTNARGGISTAGATQYLGLLDLAFTLDFERLSVPLPGRFFLLAQNAHGRGLTQDYVGDTMVLSNIDAFRNLLQVGEYWWEFGLLDDDVTIRLGRQDVNHEFYFMDLARDFIQSGFTLSPNARLPSYPHQAMAAVALVQLEESLQFKAGVWDALAPTGGWGVSGQGTVLINCELEYAYTLRDGELPGRIAVGAGYLEKGEKEGVRFGAAHGYSLQWEQWVFQEELEAEVDDPQGWAFFAAVYPRFPSDPVPEDAIGDSFAVGVVNTGLLAQRDRDVFGVGAVWAELNQGGTNQETAIELFYRAYLTERIALQPDLQYIVTPSGTHPDALVAGFRLQVNQ